MIATVIIATIQLPIILGSMTVESDREGGDAGQAEYKIIDAHNFLYLYYYLYLLTFF